MVVLTRRSHPTGGREFKEETCRDTSLSSSLDCAGGCPGFWPGLATDVDSGRWDEFQHHSGDSRLYLDHDHWPSLADCPPPGTTTTLSGTITSGSPTVVLPSTSGLLVGDPVTGTGIPANTTITQIDASGTQLTLSNNATASASESLVFTSVPAPQAYAIVEPTGGIVTPPTTATQGPLTILSGSSGFTQSGVYDYLKSTTDSSGQPVQLFGLSFYGGLAANGVLNFSLNVTNASSPPQLVSQTPGVTITLDPPASSSTSTSTSLAVTDSGTPEPLSLLLWTFLAGAGFVRVRTLRRSNRVVHNG